MFENSAELAENKLLLLYVIKSLKCSVSNSQLTDIILENNFMNYFTLQQYISELEASEFIKYENKNDKNVLVITKKGENVLSLFTDRISPNKINIINEYILSMIDSIKKELTIHSDYTIENSDSFIVDLKAFEGTSLLLELKLSVPTKKQASSLCAKWKDNPSEIYTNIINILFKDS